MLNHGNTGGFLLQEHLNGWRRLGVFHDKKGELSKLVLILEISLPK